MGLELQAAISRDAENDEQAESDDGEPCVCYPDLALP